MATPTGARPSPTRAPAPLPRLGARGWLRFAWRQLTSMQTALFLLMLLAIAAIPGSLYPQRSVNPALTDQYLQESGRWGEILDALGFFNVFSSPWFSAIYILLFISLIGCVVPRCRLYADQVRARPPRAPRRLERFVGYSMATISASNARDVLREARTRLASKHYRTDLHDLETPSDATAPSVMSLSAERGYLREAGNLLFHIALLAVLVGVALGHLTSYRGQITVIEGEGFANSLTQYDSFEPGAWFDAEDLPPFRFTLNEFRAEFSTDTSDPRTFGLPTLFEADVSVHTDDGAFERTVRVNQPITIDGSGVYLLGNGYAPALTVRDPEGQVVAEGPVIAIPQGTSYTSQLVLKMPDARPEQLAIVGIFAPTAVLDHNGPRSEYAGLARPEVFLTAHWGDLGLDSGIPQNAYQIDVSALTPVTHPDGTPVLMRLAPGERFDLPDGTSIEFTDVKRFAGFDIKRDPWQGLTLASSLLAVIGLVLSLFIPRRRMWVRITTLGNDARIEVAGLARSEDFRLESDVHELFRVLVPTAEQDVTLSDSPAKDGPGD